MPASVMTLSGSCVTVPCSFTLEDKYKDMLHPGCIPIWKKGEQLISSTTFRGNLTAFNCTTTFNNVHEDNVQYYFKIQCDGSPLKYNFYENPVTIRIKGKCNVCPSETNISHKSYWSHCGSDYAWVSIVTALNWFGTQGTLMHLVWPPPRSRWWRGLLWSWGALPRPTVTPTPPLWRGPPPWGSAPSSSRTIPWPPLWPSTPPTSTMETMSPALRPTTYHLGTKLWRLQDTNSVSHVSQCTTFSMKSTFYYLFTFLHWSSL